MKKILWVLVVMLAGIVTSCGDDDSGTPDGGGTDTDTDTDTDVDTDVDTDTDTDTACHLESDCPENTDCIKLASISTTEGFCAPLCCTFGEADATYCVPQGSGDAACLIGMSSDGGITFEQPYHCDITCTSEADCPDGTACSSEGICSGYAEVEPDAGTPDAGPDSGN
jgi:hypothetical protein